MTSDPGGYPSWAIWLVLAWLVLHLYYDLSLSRDLKAQRKPGDPPPAKLSSLFRYTEIMNENSRRFKNGDPLAQIVTYCDWAMAAGFVLLVGYRIFVGGAAR